MGGDAVLDKETGLVWANVASINTVRASWYEAIASCRNLNIAGRKGWRLPTIEELSTLLDMTLPQPFFPTDVFDNVVEWVFWSSTTHEVHEVSAYMVQFGNAYIGYYTKTHNNYRAWPVRGGTQ